MDLLAGAEISKVLHPPIPLRPGLQRVGGELVLEGRALALMLHVSREEGVNVSMSLSVERWTYRLQDVHVPVPVPVGAPLVFEALQVELEVVQAISRLDRGGRGAREEEQAGEGQGLDVGEHGGDWRSEVSWISVIA